MNPKRPASLIILALFAILASCYLTACSTWTDPVKRSATIAKLQTGAVRILGNVAVNTLQSLVSAELSGDRDFAHAAADAAWKSVRVTDLSDLINTATGERAPALAEAAANIAHDAVQNGGVTKAQAFDAVAAAISASAFKL